MKKLLSTIIGLLVATNINAIAVDVNQLKSDAIMLYSVNKIEAAQAIFQQIPENEQDAETLLLLSNIAQDMKNSQDVETLLKKAIEKDPKFYKAHYNLGNIYFNNGKINEALKSYKTALRYNNKNSYIYTNIGCCYLELKNLKFAKYYFNRAATLNPENPDNYYQLAYIYKLKGNTKKAEELIKIYNELMQNKVN